MTKTGDIANHVKSLVRSSDHDTPPCVCLR